MEPWDGPAAICFTDGVQIGTVLDRNGLRPLRYYVTKDDLVVMASEAGVLPDIPPGAGRHARAASSPGACSWSTPPEKRIISDDEIKSRYASAAPLRRVGGGQPGPHRRTCPPGAAAIEPDHETLEIRQEAFGYTAEDLSKLVQPMAETAGEAMGSMGTDTPLAVLSSRPQPLYNYFKQLFAQVTNPPVDAIREELIMAVETTIGPERNLFDPQPESARQIELRTPILFNEELEQLRALDGSRGLHGASRPPPCRCCYPVAEGGGRRWSRRWPSCAQQGLGRRWPTGSNIIILSDRNHGARAGAHPVAAGLRGGPPPPAARRDPHPGRAGGRDRRAARGAPLLPAHRLRRQRHQPLPGLRDASPTWSRTACSRATRQKLKKNFTKAVEQGRGEGALQDGHLDRAELPRRPGVRGHRPAPATSSTATSPAPRRGWAASGWTSSPRRWRAGTSAPTPAARWCKLGLEPGGQYQYRSDGEYHLFNPESIHKLQAACRTGNYDTYKQYAPPDQRPVARTCAPCAG